MEYPENWFDQVETSVISQYQNLSLKGDIDNSILAGFLLVDDSKKSINVISMATGTKLMSGEQRAKMAKNGPFFVHDCHAEILAHRAFQIWIWENLEEYFPNGELDHHYSLHFYSSQPPCGDCCVHINENEINVETGAKPFGWDQSQLAASPPNIVRGKPGRGSRSQSLSCSDKICIWLNTSLEGSYLSKMIKPLHLSSLCIGGGNKESISRALYDRIGKNIINRAEIFIGDSKWNQCDESPSASSFAWWSGCSNFGEKITPKFGRKYGVIEKNQTKEKFLSPLCDAMMMMRFCKHENINEITLRDSKKLATEYQSSKERVVSKLLEYGGSLATKFIDEQNWIFKMSNFNGGVTK